MQPVKLGHSRRLQIQTLQVIGLLRNLVRQDDVKLLAANGFFNFRNKKSLVLHGASVSSRSSGLGSGGAWM
jgi:hypothetical protein